MSDSSPVTDLQSSSAANLTLSNAALGTGSDTASIPASAEQFLRLHLMSTPVLLSVGQMTEVLTIPVSQVVPISHMPAWVMGVHNWRGEVLWMVDFAHLCGLTPWYEQRTVSAHAAVVLQIHDSRGARTSVKSRTLGLVVSQIGEMEWCDPHQIRPLPFSTATSEITQFLRGYWSNLNDDMLAVLDGEAIAKAMP